MLTFYTIFFLLNYVYINRITFCNSVHLESSRFVEGQPVSPVLDQRILHVMTAWFCGAFIRCLSNHDQKVILVTIFQL